MGERHEFDWTDAENWPQLAFDIFNEIREVGYVLPDRWLRDDDGD